MAVTTSIQSIRPVIYCLVCLTHVTCLALPYVSGGCAMTLPVARPLLTSFACRRSRMMTKVACGIQVPKYAVLVASDVAPAGTDPTEAATRYRDYFQLYQNIFRSPSLHDEHWDQFRCLDGEFPDSDILDTYRGFVVSGSRFDAHSDLEWIVKLRALIQTIHKRQRSNLVGICFGHQIVAHALGGESGRATELGWQIGVQQVQTNEAFRKVFKDELGQFSILKIHQDQVKKLPPGAVCLASSAKCQFEMFSLGDRVLCVQGHPEFSPDLLSGIVQSRIKAGTVSPELGEAALRSIRSEQPQTDSLIALLTRFLKTAH